MPAWQSSSLAVSDGMTRHSNSGLLKNTKERLSKQHIMGKAMFGNKTGRHGKDLQIGKKFRRKGKGIMHGSTSSQHGSIGPSVEEFDDMMQSQKTGNNKKGYSRKMFG